MTLKEAQTPYRADIQGLRAIAVLLVIFGHLFPQLLPGGFIGVDIFFVISGYVITQQLQHLLQSDQRSILRRFYARRLRRILIPALIVILTTVICAKILLGPIFAFDAAYDGFWSTIFAANIHFDSQSRDYFASGMPQSLLQHYWSLSIEEQFYLVWPVIFLVLARLNLTKNSRVAITAGILTTSLAFSLAQIYLFNKTNFFSGPARAWELLAGCTLALTHVRARKITVLRFSSILLLMLFPLFLDQTMMWPDLYTVVIILLTLVICYPRENTQFRVLDNRAMVFIGDISYLLYLWHWPVLTITKNYVSNVGFTEIAFIIVATLALSISTFFLIERPLRRNTILISYPVTTVFSGLALIAATAIYLRSYL